MDIEHKILIDRQGNREVTMIEIPGTIKKVTPRGGVLLQVVEDFYGKEVLQDLWFPITQTYNPVEDIQEGAEIDLLVSEWIAKEKEII